MPLALLPLMPARPADPPCPTVPCRLSCGAGLGVALTLRHLHWATWICAISGEALVPGTQRLICQVELRTVTVVPWHVHPRPGLALSWATVLLAPEADSASHGRLADQSRSREGPPCAAFLPPDLQRGPTVALQMALKTPASVSL